jgi:hypothetical protein
MNRQAHALTEGASPYNTWGELMTDFVGTSVFDCEDS